MCGSLVPFGTTAWMITSTAGCSDLIGVGQENHGGRLSTIYWQSGDKILHQQTANTSGRKHAQCIYSVYTLYIKCMEFYTLYIQSVYTLYIHCINSVYTVCIKSVYRVC